MAALLATSFVVFALLGRVALQYRATGNHGIRLADPKAEPIAAIAGLVFSASFAIGLSVVAADWLNLWTLVRLNLAYLNQAALLVGLLGVALVFVSQLQMGSAWRIGVDPSERTTLITHGFYRTSRNPIYFGLALYWVGLSVLLPHFIIWVPAVLCWISIEVIVRLVEEPYLQRTHGQAFEDYFGSTNRYLIWR